MPRIIPIEAGQSSQVAFTGRRAEAADFQSGNVEGVVKFIKTIQENAEQKELLDVAVKEAEDRVRSDKIISDLGKTLSPDDPEFSSKALEEIQRQRDALGISFQTRKAQEAYDIKTRIGDARSLGLANEYQSVRVGKHAREQIEKIIDTTSVAIQNDPSSMGERIASLQELVDSHPLFAKLPAEARDDIRKKAEATYAVAAIQGMIQVNPEAAIQALNDGMVDSYVPSQTKIALLKSADQQKDEAAREADAAAKKAFAGDYADLQVRASRGDTTYAELDRHRETHPMEWSVLTRTLDDALRAKNNLAAAVARVDNVYHGQGVPELHSADYRKGVDAHAAEILGPAIEAADPVDRPGMVAAYTNKIGVLPSSVKTMITGGLRSGTLDNVTSASDMVRRLHNTNPALLNEIPREDVALADHFLALTDAGYPPERALTVANEAAKMTDPVKKARLAAYDEEVRSPAGKASRNSVWLADKEFSIFRFGEPDIPLGMQAEFDNAVKTEFTRTGDLEMARKMGYDHLQRRWSRSKINGKNEYMKFAPEREFQGGEEGVDWMREQLKADVAAYFRANPPLEGGSDGEAILSASGRKVNPVNGKVVYDVAWVSNGIIQFNMMEWQPNWEASPANQRRKADVQRIFEGAKRKHTVPPAIGDIIAP